MRPRGCLRPSPPSTECRGGLCARAAWRLRRGRYYLSNAADAGFARRPPPFGRYMTDAARFPSGMRPDASGGRLGRPASAGEPSTGARGVVPLPSSRQARTPYLVSRSSFRGVSRGTGVLYLPGFASILQAASPNTLNFPKSAWNAASACCFLPLRTFDAELCINYSATSSFSFSQALQRELLSRASKPHRPTPPSPRLSVSARTPASSATRVAPPGQPSAP